MTLRLWAATAAVGWSLLGAATAAEKETAAQAGLVPPNTLSDAEKTAGWTLLFDGKSLDGWRNYKQPGIGDGWKVVDGALVRAAAGAGDIVTKEQYENFELMLDYKISEGGNSGLMFHVTETAATPWQTGPEIQIQDNVKGHDPQKAGWLYQLYEPFKPGWVKQVGHGAKADEQGRLDATRPTGEWNTLYVRIAKSQSAVVMNGYPYYQFVVGSDDWNKRLAKSKFAAFPDFGKPETGHISLQDHGNEVAFRNIKVRKIGPNGAAPNPVDGELSVRPVLAFPDLEFADWNPEEEPTKSRELRPISIAHAGDGSGRLFAGMQRGLVHVFDAKPDVKTTKVFLDIQKKVADYWGPGQNEEGFLGLAFHPNYKKNGRLYVYYTAADPGHVSVLSEFKVSKDEPNKADPSSEKELFRIEQPYANHNGGSIEFGPDGYLYIGMGDGGSAYDPHGNGQNLGVPLGKVLRIDVDKPADGKSYGIPADNPFRADAKADARVFAYGFRNPWRLTFDAKTGRLWVADVGQDLWEEIDVVTKGGNYGWSGREGSYPFGDGRTQGSAPIPPVWEYDHQTGKSVTGGAVYRGPSVPELDGKYLYADYVTGKLWALTYDDATGKATANDAIPGPTLGVLGYGADEAGEVYFGIGSANGKGIYKFESTAKRTAAR